MTRKNPLLRGTAILAVGALSIGLAACSSTGGEDDVVTIEYLHRLPDGEGMTPVSEIVARWNEENPNIQVNATKFDGAAQEMILKLETDINADAGPCLAQVGYGEVPELFVKGLFEDVTEEANSYADNFSAGALGMMRVGETLVGLPQDTGPLVYFYNETAFNELGLEVPTTSEELAAIAATAAADGQYVTAFTPDEATYWLSGMAAAAGDVWFTAENEEWVVNTTGEGAQRVAAFWQDAIDSETTLIEQRWGDGFTQALLDGSLIGHIGAAWEVGFLLDPLDGTEAEGQWRIAQLPDFGAGQMTGPDGGSGVAVMKGCENPAEAMEFNDWFNTQIDDLAGQGLVVAASGTPETSEKALRQFGGQNVLEVLAAANDTLNPDFTYMPGFSTLNSMTETADAAATGSVPVMDIFETAQSTAVDTLTNLGLPVAER